MIIDKKMLSEFHDRFSKDAQSNLIKNSVAKNGIYKTSFNNDVLREHNFLFSNEVKTGDITNQKSSGRCWIFASLNMARIAAIKNFKVKNIEFSENYAYFWEKMEKANTFFENVIQHGLDLDFNDRLFVTFMNEPISDGGYWEWYLSINKKYGVVPKSAMPETFHSESSNLFSEVLNTVAKKHALKFIEAHKAKKDKKLPELKKEALYDIYNICVKALGLPPETFDYEWKDKDDKFHKEENLTPQSFYEKFIGKELDDKVTLVCDPREIYPYGRKLESKYFKTVYEGNLNVALNVPMEELKSAAIKSIKANKSVWFACDVSQFGDRELGILDSKLYDLDNVLVSTKSLTKAQKVNMRIIAANHAMNFIGVDLDKKGNPIKWKVENSWGDKNGNKGIFSMTDEWFTDYNFECIVDKKYVSKKYLKGLEQDSILLEPWDPMA